MGALKQQYKYDTGYTHIVQAQNKTMKKLKVCGLEEFKAEKEEFKNKKDIYYTPNTFNSPLKRTANSLWQLHNFYIDIDQKGNTPIDQYKVIMAIESMAEMNLIPYPTEYNDSGRGIHVYWNIESCHIMLLDLWQKIENDLFNKIKELEKTIDNIKVDRAATDPTRLLRLTGTINSKSNTKCYTMLRREENIYNIFDLKKLYIKPTKAHKSNKTGVIQYPKNLFTLNTARLKDFESIVKLRSGKVTGYRNSLIMLYSYHYRLMNEVTLTELIQEVTEFNKAFKEPYKATELKNVCRSVTRAVKYFREDNTKGYRFRNDYIIELLDLTDKEQSNLLTIISKQVKYDRKNAKRYPRNEKGLTSRQQQKEDTIKAIQELKQQGLNNTEIAEKLGMNRVSVSRIINNKLQV